MAAEEVLALVLDFGVVLFASGAETHRVEDSLYRLAAAFGFRGCNFWVIPSNVQATVTAPDGAILTQIRHVRGGGMDFSRLDELNTLCRRACSGAMDAEVFASRLEELREARPLRAWSAYLGGVLAGAGFGVFFGCDALDACAAGCTSLLVVFLSRRIGAHENNPLIVNFIISCVAEVFILFSVKHGFGHHAGYIAAGVVMLLISALGTTNGVRDLARQDTLSGLLNIILSLVGASGIALGIALPLRLFGSAGSAEIMTLNPRLWLELLAAAVGCFGFSLALRVNLRHALWCVAGAVLTWGVYLLAWRSREDGFFAALCASVFCSLFAQIVSRVEKSPATIFQTIAIFPVIPGAALYYMMYGAVVGDRYFAVGKGLALASGCFGIVLGFMLIETLTRIILPVPPLPGPRDGRPEDGHSEES